MSSTAGSMASGCASANSPNAAKRSATNALPYTSAPVSYSGATSTVATEQPRSTSCCTTRSKHRRASSSPRQSIGAGTPMRVSGRARSAMGTDQTSYTARVSATSAVNTDTQSNERIAGTTPSFDRTPGVGLAPTTPHNAAGTRPDPAVSVPSANDTSPVATTIAEPELEPPAISSGSSGLRHGP